MSMRKSLITLASLAATVGIVTACGNTNGTVDNHKLEGQIRTWAVAKQGATPNAHVTCPSGIQLKAGTTFHCLIHTRGQAVRVAVTIENNQGYATWVVG